MSNVVPFKSDFDKDRFLKGLTKMKDDYLLGVEDIILAFEDAVSHIENQLSDKPMYSNYPVDSFDVEMWNLLDSTKKGISTLDLWFDEWLDNNPEVVAYVE